MWRVLKGETLCSPFSEKKELLCYLPCVSTAFLAVSSTYNALLGYSFYAYYIHMFGFTQVAGLLQPLEILGELKKHIQVLVIESGNLTGM